MATYNGQKYIHEQLASILPQLGDDDEVIISDDGSTDGTLDIIAAFNDRRIKVYHHVETITTTFLLDKPTHNFENAIRHARGNVIFLADQDDVWLPDKVQTMCKALKNADLVIHDCTVVDENKHVLHDSYFEYNGLRRSLIGNIIKMSYLGCCMAMKKSVIDAALPFPKTKVGHDFWITIIAKLYFKTIIIQQPLILYRRHHDNKTMSGEKSNHSLWFKINYRLTTLMYITQKLIKQH